jgi:hypothetical protein
MSSFGENIDGVNPVSIATQAELTELLTGLGFVSQPVTRSPIVVLRRTPSDFKDEPRRNLMAQANNLTNHSMVIVEDSAFVIYYYDEPNDLYRIWDELRGNVQFTVLRETIVAAMTIETVMKRLGY